MSGFVCVFSSSNKHTRTARRLESADKGKERAKPCISLRTRVPGDDS